MSLELENGTIEGVSMNLTDFNTGRGLSGDINDLILAATREINFRGVSVSHTFFTILCSLCHYLETFSTGSHSFNISSSTSAYPVFGAS